MGKSGSRLVGTRARLAGRRLFLHRHLHANRFQRVVALIAWHLRDHVNDLDAANDFPENRIPPIRAAVVLQGDENWEPLSLKSRVLLPSRASYYRNRAALMGPVVPVRD